MPDPHSMKEGITAPKPPETAKPPSSPAVEATCHCSDVVSEGCGCGWPPSAGSGEGLPSTQSLWARKGRACIAVHAATVYSDESLRESRPLVKK